ncbi:hypothetical protein BpHYR1_048691 [Brachionus plicatilis]|uniref:Uncharacterized protein n=1 Tax=Brachionus plicatilis TaxID=10195 RepID=A0A3M7S4N5_BRAPC|nr:hypothetical protein BpHYR1_048691 [Brachionus plicatilis]
MTCASFKLLCNTSPPSERIFSSTVRMNRTGHLQTNDPKDRAYLTVVTGLVFTGTSSYTTYKPVIT